MVSLTRLATFRLPSCTTNLVVARGSVVDFCYEPNSIKSGIVNAANEGCLGGGGVDGAISDAGGDALLQDRLALPNVGGVRCPTGQAKITGPNDYGSLEVPYVIHAVGPSYFNYPSYEEPDELLANAYKNSLECASQAQLEGLAFSLLSAGVFRGERKVKDVLQIGMQAICDYHESNESTLRDVFLCAFNEKEAKTLTTIAEDLNLQVKS